MFTKGLGSFPEREEEILAFWEENELFLRSLNLREGSPLFSFYDGPPFATGLPHYGHLIAGTIKDVIPRYQTMRGFYVPRCFGWDCHGLPVENEIEKTKNISGAHEIETLGIATFNTACEQIVLRYTAEWERTVRRLGRWVDFRQTYRTMDRDFMETIWWVFGQLWKRGLIYEGFKVMPFSAKLGTPLSNFEANLNYQEVEDPSIVVTLPLLEEERTSLLIWTTTPWTLPANLAAAVNEELSYVKIFDREREHYFILGEGRARAYFDENMEVISTFKGSRLLGKRYRPPFEYFFDQHPLHAFKVISGSFVDEKDGTGIVHVAPAFGEVDFLACQKEEIPLICPVDQNGRFTDEVPDYKGLFVKDSDRRIIKRLKGSGRIFDHRQTRHRYPFCWRSDTPLIYKAVNTWFLSVEQLRERLLIANEKIR